MIAGTLNFLPGIESGKPQYGTRVLTKYVILFLVAEFG